MMQGGPPSTPWPAAAPAGTPHDDALGVLPPGTMIGKYEIVGTLGQGGFGITYRARDARLGREVAIKEYLPTAFAQRQGGSTVLPRSTRTAEDFLWGRERFLDEAKTLAHLENTAAIVNVYDFLEANGTVYMVMALVRGETLEARLQRDHRLPQPAIEQMLYPLLDGLEIVHKAGFLHRDIKPANILLDSTGRPTLIDFGASRTALQGRTQLMTAVYTPQYAAFEQVTSSTQGPFTDVYALAATLYHCVVGQAPPTALERISEDRLVPTSVTVRTHYSPILLGGIDAGLRLRAPDRPQTIAEWRRILTGAVAPPPPQGAVYPTQSATPPATGYPPSPSAMQPPTGYPAMAQPPMPVQTLGGPSGRRQVAPPVPAGGGNSRALLWAALVAVVLVVAGVGGWMLTEELSRRAEAERQAVLLRQQQEEAARVAAEQERARQEEARRQETERERLRQEDLRRQQAEERQRQEMERRAVEERQQREAEARRRAEEEARERARREAQARQKQEAATQGWMVDERTGCRIWNPGAPAGQTVTWSGECVNGVAQGQGTLQWFTNGRPTDRYVGAYSGGKRSGRGVLTEADGDRYEGEWRDDAENGRGTFFYRDGGRYEGDWRDGRPSGTGLRIWANGERYDGEWRDGKRNGRGTYTWPDGARYEGGFVEDRRHGKGTYTWADGARYEGDYREGNRTGQGTYVWRDGGRYTGEWRNNVEHGRGLRTWPDGSRYEGEWREGKAHGSGTRTTKDARTFSGQWVNGCFRQGERWATVGTTAEACGFR